MDPDKRRPLAPKGGNDQIFTPPELATAIVEYFKPRGTVLDPCKGRGAFYDALARHVGVCSWCEITEGHDFFHARGHWDWIITNPPWSKFRPFLNRAMLVADNVVFLALLNAWFMRARVRDMREAGFGIKEILLLDTPPKPWPQTGFQLGAVHIQRGYAKNSCKINFSVPN